MPMSDAGRPEEAEFDDETLDVEALSARFEEGYAALDRGDAAAAAEAFRAALALDPLDRGGAALRLAALGAGPVRERAPPTYVSMLFDEHAAEFDSLLVADLGYAVPRMMADRLRDLGLAPGARVVDLGCGTGLAAAELGDLAGHLTGIDLSVGMLLQARRRGGYAKLVLGEAAAALDGETEAGEPPADAVLAADLVIYLGRLEPLFAAVARRLRPGGVFLVSTETLAEPPAEPWTYRVGEGARFAHAPAYLRAALEGAGLALLSLEPISVRMQADQAVPGHLAVARRAG